MRARHHLLALIAAALLPQAAQAAEPVHLLFVGNSYTFGRVDPVMSYNAGRVQDLTAGFNALDPAGTNSHPPGTAGAGSFEPHPWGGVPGIFKQFADEAGLAYEVALSTRNAISLRGHLLNTPGPAWDLRGNLARRRWDQVVLQELSDGALPPGRGKNANLARFNAYADRLERFLHDGSAQRFSEAQLLGSVEACTATGLSAADCATVHTLPANPQASAATQIFLEQTWARPDMVEAHATTHPDIHSADGRPVAEHRGAADAARLYYASLADMTADLHRAFQARAAANPGFAGVVPVGDAFQRAVDQGVARGSGFYAADAGSAGIDLWWLDRTHASKFGSYLSALTLFGRLTGRDPMSLPEPEQAAADLGIDAATARQLRRVASQALGFQP